MKYGITKAKTYKEKPHDSHLRVLSAGSQPHISAFALCEDKKVITPEIAGGELVT